MDIARIEALPELTGRKYLQVSECWDDIVGPGRCLHHWRVDEELRCFRCALCGCMVGFDTFRAWQVRGET